MRNHALLAVLALVALVAAAAGTALASGSGAHSDTPSQKRGDGARGDDDGNHTATNKTATNASARAEAAKARHAELKAARDAALGSFRENRSAAIEAFRAAHNETKASFLENKTRVIEACNAARNATRDANETGQPSHAKCVQDGLKPLIQKARAEHQAAKDAFQERLKSARQAAMESFRALRADADARHGHHRSG